MKRPLGCLSGVGLLAAMLTLLVVAGVALIAGGGWFSPGRLNAQSGPGDASAAATGGIASHADTGGDCAACHPAPWSAETMGDRCTACHTAMQDSASHLAQFHALLWRDIPEQPCRTCHPEHRGAEAALTEVSVADFPHEATGFSLAAHRETAAGAAFVCADCHADNLTAFAVETCADCHTQLDPAYMAQHRADFGASCLGCHDGIDRFSGFDHNMTAFALAGSHVEANCGDCHNATTPADFAQAPTTCVECHRADDAHDGEFGADCGGCHTPDDWENATFDHAQTQFPLVGQHADLACAECHADAPFGQAPTTCDACHVADDAHNGEFGADCGGCHTPDGWENATFDHAQTAFPLAGAHQQVACAECHPAGQFQGTPIACASCHGEPAFHQALFDTACETCHTPQAWLPATFNLPHSFPINHGEQGASACRTCHPDALAAYTCYGCHEHTVEETIQEHQDEGIGDIADCARCHPTGQEDEAERD